jgi:hypothetical protein
LSDEQRIKEIRERAEKATKGPWEWHIHDHSAASIEGPELEMDHVLTLGPCKSCQPRVKETGKFFGSCTVPKEGNAAFIVWSRADIPFLLDALEKALRERDEAKALLKQAVQRLEEEFRNQRKALLPGRE